MNPCCEYSLVPTFECEIGDAYLAILVLWFPSTAPNRKAKKSRIPWPNESIRAARSRIESRFEGRFRRTNTTNKGDTKQRNSFSHVRTFLGAPFWRKGRTHSSCGTPNATFSLPHSSAFASIDLGRGAVGDLRRRRLGVEGDAAEGRPRTRRWTRAERRRVGAAEAGVASPSTASGGVDARGGGGSWSSRRGSPIGRAERRRGCEDVEAASEQRARGGWSWSPRRCSPIRRAERRRGCEDVEAWSLDSAHGGRSWSSRRGGLIRRLEQRRDPGGAEEVEAAAAGGPPIAAAVGS